MSIDATILIVVAVEAEKDAILRGLNREQDNVDVLVAGVGIASSAAKTSQKLAERSYSHVVSAGIAGGFIERAPVGSVVVSSEIIQADFGADSEEGFLPIEELGFGSSIILVQAETQDRLVQALEERKVTVTSGQILTLSTVTGTQYATDQLNKRYPLAVAEAMEGFGVATAASLYNIPVLEVRTISNPIGPRDREAWKIKDALDQLEIVSKTIVEVLR
ncbi:futalosine hydrolase [Bacillus sp. FJAT-45037]|uniref:futalosine hydrolase n=1 Tax=Bacillus sp. FJAT-45037 TaxID=2011007 RepID=UPI000C230385|nr:futalosine hydrolase [Bacillus sp. FJAT-45037]